MNLVEQSQNRLILGYQKSFLRALAIGITFIPFGLSLGLLGLALLREYNAGIIALLSGCVIIAGGIYTIIVDTEVNTYKFDKITNLILLKRHNRLTLSTKYIEFPFHLIIGIELENISGSEGGMSFYPQLILASIYWRIPIKSNGSYQDSVNTCQMIAQFLNIPYFTNQLEAPVPIHNRKISDNLKPW